MAAVRRDDAQDQTVAGRGVPALERAESVDLTTMSQPGRDWPAIEDAT